MNSQYSIFEKMQMIYQFSLCLDQGMICMHKWCGRMKGVCLWAFEGVYVDKLEGI